MNSRNQMGLILVALLSAISAHAVQQDVIGPANSGRFGASVTALSNGNFVVTDPGFDAPGITDVGASYLYTPNGTLLSTLTGSLAGDQLGSGGVLVLANGHYLVRSPNWNGARGAVTWGNASNGVTGILSAANSLVGGTANDQVGAVTALSNGNYVLASAGWDAPSPTALDAGAVTWGNGAGGTVGLVSAANSLVGTMASDRVGEGVIALSNSNYVVRSTRWNGDRGAISWGNGAGGTVGLVSAANSLVGGTAGDSIGFGNGDSNGVTALSNGNYVVSSPAAMDVGAVTWGNGAGGTVGLVSAANSLVGSTAGDQVGGGFGTGVGTQGGVFALSNGNYVVSSINWDTPSSVVNVGAVTWGNGAGGTVGLVSAANSLVGATANDRIGTGSGSSPGVTALNNGNYVVRGTFWDAISPPVLDVGAATWGNGTGGTVGLISAANALVGTTANDRVGGTITVLSNGNYVVGTSGWDAGALVNVGAVTWGNGAGGTVGQLSGTNSLVGGTTNDFVSGGIGGNAGGVTALSNGNYVVRSSNWDAVGPAVVDVGAATWGNGTGGTVGLVSAANSLVGAQAGDSVSGLGDSVGVTALSNGNYVVTSQRWAGAGPMVSAGAATWGNGMGGTVGLVSAANSLVGGTQSDSIGRRVTALSNGNYVVASPFWNAPGPVSAAGAASWGNGTGGTVGIVSAANSLVGSSLYDGGNDFRVTALGNGNYVVVIDFWDGPAANSGAITRGIGTGGTVGVISTVNSVLGANQGGGLVFSYDLAGARLIVGRPSDNIVTIFSEPPELFFRNGFE